MSEAATKNPGEAKKPKQGRSPAYPAISLSQAIEKAKAQYEAEGKYPAPMTSAFKAWGFGAKSSGGRDVRAALKYFGLAVVEGDGETGKVKLTDDALRVLLDEREDQTEKKAIIRRLALTPAIHKKLLEQFPDGIKSDATAEHFLVFEQNYNKSAAGEVVSEFKATADFAELFKPATMVVKPAQDEDGDDQPGVTPGGSDGVSGKIPPKPPVPKGQVKIMESERVAFIEELQPGNYLKLIASGDLNDFLLEALEDFVKRQRKLQRFLNMPAGQAKRPDGIFNPGDKVPVSGMYLQLHPSEHAVAHKVSMKEGDTFPVCSTCGNETYFKQVGILE